MKFIRHFIWISDIRKYNSWYQKISFEFLISKKFIFLYQKIEFLILTKMIFWYQKMDQIFLYQEFEFLISKNHFLISENTSKILKRHPLLYNLYNILTVCCSKSQRDFIVVTRRRHKPQLSLCHVNPLIGLVPNSVSFFLSCVPGIS